MKQAITQDQYEELSPEAQQRYIEWTLTKDDQTIAYRSIVHLIWFLDEHITEGWWQIQRCGEKTDWRIASKYGPDFESEEFPELCDALWNAVKMVLEEQSE